MYSFALDMAHSLGKRVQRAGQAAHDWSSSNWFRHQKTKFYNCARGYLVRTLQSVLTIRQTAHVALLYFRGELSPRRCWVYDLEALTRALIDINERLDGLGPFPSFQCQKAQSRGSTLYERVRVSRDGRHTMRTLGYKASSDLSHHHHQKNSKKVLCATVNGRDITDAFNEYSPSFAAAASPDPCDVVAGDLLLVLAIRGVLPWTEVVRFLRNRGSGESQGLVVITGDLTELRLGANDPIRMHVFSMGLGAGFSKAE